MTSIRHVSFLAGLLEEVDGLGWVWGDLLPLRLRGELGVWRGGQHIQHGGVVAGLVVAKLAAFHEIIVCSVLGTKVMSFELASFTTLRTT